MGGPIHTDTRGDGFVIAGIHTYWLEWGGSVAGYFLHATNGALSMAHGFSANRVYWGWKGVAFPDHFTLHYLGDWLDPGELATIATWQPYSDGYLSSRGGPFAADSADWELEDSTGAKVGYARRSSGFDWWGHADRFVVGPTSSLHFNAASIHGRPPTLPFHKYNAADRLITVGGGGGGGRGGRGGGRGR